MSKSIKLVTCLICVNLLLLCGCGNLNTNNKQTSNNNVTTDENNVNTNNNSKENNSTVTNNTKDTQKDNKIILDKQIYLDRMATVDDDLNIKFKDKFNGTTLDMLQASNEIYKTWDDILNEIYLNIMNTLTKDEKDKLISDENTWIQARDKKADAAAKEMEGGTLEPVLRAGSLGTSTKERCYYLVNTYMK